MPEIAYELARLGIVMAFGFLAVVCFISGYKLFFSDSVTYNLMHRSSGGWRKIIKGTVSTKKDGVRTHNVVAGLAYDLKEEKVVPQGTLSNEAIEKLLR